jgi:hypothetical protein
MRTNDVFPKKFIGADVIGDKEFTLTIDKVVLKTVGDEQKPVAYFKDAKKGLVLNRTNWDRISFIAQNDDSDAWPGVSVVLTTELVSFNGKTGAAVRVKPARRGAPSQPQTQQPAPDQPTPPLSEALGDEIKF